MRDKRFPGHKRRRKPIRKNAKRYVSPAQKKKNLLDKKVREGETLETWERRVRKRKLMSETQIDAFLNTKKIVIKRRRETLQNERNKDKYLIVSNYITYFDYLKYYGVVMNYFSIKYQIRQDDFEIAFMFYNNIVFDKERFDNVCILNVGNSTNYFKRFLDLGYITHLMRKGKPTDVYKLSHSMRLKLNLFYETLTGFYLPKVKKVEVYLHHELVRAELIKMNEEINAMLTGDIPQKTINDD